MQGENEDRVISDGTNAGKNFARWNNKNTTSLYRIISEDICEVKKIGHRLNVRNKSQVIKLSVLLSEFITLFLLIVEKKLNFKYIIQRVYS